MSQLIALLKTMRPKQWVTKNSFIFVPLLFDHKAFEFTYILNTIIGFALLSLVTGTVYLMNDLVDIEADRAHPKKKNRPLPSGQLSIKLATTTAVLLPIISLPIAYSLNPKFAAILASYLAIQIAYSFKLKQIVLIDVMIISAGFLLRVAAGVALIDAERFSPWLYIFTMTLALFLGFGKRRHEKITLQEEASNHRAILDEYSIPFLDTLIMIVTTMTIMTYSLYSFSAEGLPENNAMMLSVPFLIYGMFRYLYLIHVKGEGGAPDEIALRDRPIQIAVALWGLTVSLVLYLF